jgi:hypothetical protein
MTCFPPSIMYTELEEARILQRDEWSLTIRMGLRLASRRQCPSLLLSAVDCIPMDPASRYVKATFAFPRPGIRPGQQPFTHTLI